MRSEYDTRNPALSVASLPREWLRAPGDRRAFERWSVTIATVALSLLLEVLIERTTGATLPLLLLIPVAVTTWYFGAGAGLIATGLLASTVALIVLPPDMSLRVGSVADQVRLAAFVVVGIATVIAFSALARALRRNEQLLEEPDELIAGLEDANEIKDEFLGLVSHELKTPMTIVIGNAALLHARWRDLDAEERTGALGDIVREGQRLQHMVDNLLLLARSEDGSPPEPEPVLVIRAIEAVVARKQREAPEREFVIVQRQFARPVLCVQSYLDQVIDNLLSNAVKYSPAGSPVTVEVRRDERDVEVRVLDEGVGIDAAEAEALFNPFYRSRSTAGRAAGMGIGLAVCKRLIEAQGGTVWANAREKRGSEFGFSLPCIEPEPEDGHHDGAEIERDSAVV